MLQASILHCCPMSLSGHRCCFSVNRQRLSTLRRSDDIPLKNSATVACVQKERTAVMRSLEEMLKHPDEIYPLIKLGIMTHWASCSRVGSSLVPSLQQLNPKWNAAAIFSSVLHALDTAVAEKPFDLNQWIRGAVTTAMAVAPEKEHQEDDDRIAHPNDDLRKLVPLSPGLRRELMPRHVAVIMDGNARWARQWGLPVSSGHAAGVPPLLNLIELSSDWGIRVLTLFAFSSENWSRPEAEVNALMGLMERTIESNLQKCIRQGVRISTIGDSSKLPESLREVLTKAERLTKGNSKLHVVFAISYSGKSDITQACRIIARKVKDGLLDSEDVDEKLIEKELATSCTEFPCPDLLIRTSGELRLSNFLMWQLSYTELFFSQALWPDFGKAEFAKAIHSFQQRKRRYGSRYT